MPRPVRPLVSLAVAGALLAGTLLLPGAAVAAPAAGSTGSEATEATAADQRAAREKKVPDAVVPTIRWASCGSAPEVAEFQCATVTVPQDYDKPFGARISLALTRLPATSPSTRIGTVFTNPGGPGGSGVEFVQNAAKIAYTPAVRARFDILGFDPRGVAGSTPATCFADEAEEAEFSAGLLPFPVTSAEERRFVRETRQLARACASTSPRRFEHMSTADVARDMDLLRRAVGDVKLSYAGYSYGTFLGATYATLFPGNIRAMMLDGTVDPREWSGFAARYRNVSIGTRIEQDRGGDEVFREFHRACRAAGPACSMNALGNPEVVARQVLDRLKRQPVTLDLPDGTSLELTYQLMVATTFSSLYAAAAWGPLADLYSLVAVEQAGSARRTALTDAARSDVGALVRQARRGVDYASVGGALGSLCADSRQPRASVYPRLADRQDARFPDFGRYRAWVGYQCNELAAQGIKDTDAYTGGWTQTTNAQVLVLGTRWDPATPYKNTRPYAGLFRHAPVLTLAGWGHTTVGQSACVDQKVSAYLLNPTVPRADATCGSDVAPFAEVSGAVAAERAAAQRLVTPVG